MFAYFPKIQYDTARVFVRRGDYSVNVVGVIQDGIFQYRANAYVKNSPWDPQYRSLYSKAFRSLLSHLIASFMSALRSKADV